MLSNKNEICTIFSWLGVTHDGVVVGVSDGNGSSGDDNKEGICKRSILTVALLCCIDEDAGDIKLVSGVSLSG